MHSNIEPLSDREEEIYNEILTGKTLQEIADTLMVARCTIATHISNILLKKQAKNRLELLALRIKELEQAA